VGFLAIIFTVTFLIRVNSIVIIGYSSQPLVRFGARIGILLFAEWIPSMMVLFILNPITRNVQYSFIEEPVLRT